MTIKDPAKIKSRVDKFTSVCLPEHKESIANAIITKTYCPEVKLALSLFDTENRKKENRYVFNRLNSLQKKFESTRLTPVSFLSNVSPTKVFTETDLNEDKTNINIFQVLPNYPQNEKTTTWNLKDWAWFFFYTISACVIIVFIYVNRYEIYNYIIKCLPM